MIGDSLSIGIAAAMNSTAAGCSAIDSNSSVSATGVGQRNSKKSKNPGKKNILMKVMESGLFFDNFQFPF